MSDSEHTTAYRGAEIPTPLGDQLQLALGLDERPEAFGDWVDALAFRVERDDIDVDLNMPCTIDDSPHKATFDGRTHHYQCFQDPILVSFLAEDVDVVEIETESPVSGDLIELTVTEIEIEATPSDVVMSFGVAKDVRAPAADVPSPTLAYSRFCPYANVFLSHEENRDWDAEYDHDTEDEAAETPRASTAGLHKDTHLTWPCFVSRSYLLCWSRTVDAPLGPPEVRPKSARSPPEVLERRVGRLSPRYKH